MNNEIVRRAFTVKGQVQGVGFRPFVWRLAREHNLSGFVRNTSHGVRMELQGREAEINALVKNFWRLLPPQARVTGMDEENAAVIPGEKFFEILESVGLPSQNILPGADVAPCSECLAEMRDPSNPRYRHPFISCTNCGPRFSIISSLPYDRETTSMGCFPLCPLCGAEYADPANRRFHAQPVACPDCGPALWFAASASEAENRITSGENALKEAVNLLKAGKILTLKGLGGFQLACGAHLSIVDELRIRKKRPHKAFAVMVKNMASAEKLCIISEAQKKLLESQERPIVFVKKKITAPLSQAVAPDSPFLGLMLPSTPLHELLFADLGDDFPLVMTSGNLSGEPLCVSNREAIARLSPIADGFLLHDRDIAVRVDDSVAAMPDGASDSPIFMRRARGYVPRPIKLPERGPCVLGTGAELKTAFCLTRGDDAFLSQHLGDMENLATEEFYRETLAHFQHLLEVRPEIIAHDLHPNFTTTKIARELAKMTGASIFGLQHHAAHAAALCAANGVCEPALVFCLDGSGLGDDGAIWGGELILMNGQDGEWKRVGSFMPFVLAGGDAAIREPWRVARSLAIACGLAEAPSSAEFAALDEMLRRGINCIQTSSCGRLFDAVSSRLGLCDKISYEGQAALRLESCATRWLESKAMPDFPEITPIGDEGMPLFDVEELFRQVVVWQEEGVDKGEIAVKFHGSLARSIAGMLHEAAEKYRVGNIGLSGGVMQNMLFSRLVMRELHKFSLAPLPFGAIPVGDGGLSLGQAWFGQRLRANGKI